MFFTVSHSEKEVPEHPCLELISNSEDKLTLLISRRLITMKKIKEYDQTKKNEYQCITRKSLKTYNLSYCDLMETVLIALLY